MTNSNSPASLARPMRVIIVVCLAIFAAVGWSRYFRIKAQHDELVPITRAFAAGVALDIAKHREGVQVEEDEEEFKRSQMEIRRVMNYAVDHDEHGFDLFMHFCRDKLDWFAFEAEEKDKVRRHIEAIGNGERH